MMQRFIATIFAMVSIVVFSTAVWGQTVSVPLIKKSPVPNPSRVLFLGNSLVYYNGALQTHTHRIAAAGTPALDVRQGYKSVHITGAGLSQYPIEYLVTPGNLENKLPFELVVLAGNSQDSMSEMGRANYRKNVIEFDAVIKKHGGRTALLWLPAVVKPHPQAGGDMFRRNEEMMLSVGNEVGALIIPVGLAYQEAYRQRPGIQLQVGYDGNHPTLAGQYLAASVVYATLYERSPVGVAYDYFGALDKDTREFVQKVAFETVQRFFSR